MLAILCRILLSRADMPVFLEGREMLDMKSGRVNTG